MIDLEVMIGYDADQALRRAGEEAAADWLNPAEKPSGEVLAERVAAAGADWLDRKAPGWAQRCDPALLPHDLGRLCTKRVPQVGETELIGAWMLEIARRRSQ